MWQPLKIEGFCSGVQKQVVREKSCNCLENVNFNSKIKGLLNRRGKKSSREEKMSFIGFFCLEALLLQQGCKKGKEMEDGGIDVVYLYVYI